jgi:NTP pyrophosphatase (non-canonical NTP hydrolase)
MDQNKLMQPELAVFIAERGWEPFHQPKDLAIAILVECGELLELFQWRQNSDIEELLQEQTYRESVSEEIADVFIYLLALANRLDVDVVGAARTKLRKNAEKYPVDQYRGLAHWPRDELRRTENGENPASRQS